MRYGLHHWDQLQTHGKGLCLPGYYDYLYRTKLEMASTFRTDSFTDCVRLLKDVDSNSTGIFCPKVSYFTLSLSLKNNFW